MGSRKKAKEKNRQRRNEIEQNKQEKQRLEAEEKRKKEAKLEMLRQQFVAAGKEYYLVMYDVRGIQNYIFRTAKIKDAIGGSSLIEKIIEDALRDSLEKVSRDDRFIGLTSELDWCGTNGPNEFIEDYKDVKVLFIGGGNAFVLISSEELLKEINSHMARYVIDKTYSLQLAVACVKKSDNYADDYSKLYKEMIHVKEVMIVSKPLGALPVMKTEVKTGYPTAYESKDCKEDPDAGAETRLKKNAANDKRDKYAEEEKILDSFITEKGTDSTLGIVHIDGNNMGSRIRSLVQDKKQYADAVNTMRKISYQINMQYKNVFREMKDFFDKMSGKHKEYEKKTNDYFVMEILAAGDDITYVCNGKIALASVEYFCRHISKYAMSAESDEEREKNVFSVCAGIAYAGSHFPFSIAYEVAEACCENAKKTAKVNLDDGRVGNWVDFAFCKNVQTQNLEKTRRREYLTYSNEQLLLRPYYIPVDVKSHDGTFDRLEESQHSLASFNRKVDFFQNEKNIPRSQSKDLRNTYSLGEHQVKILASFLESRRRKFPDGEEMYCEEKGNKIARYYDALEMMDMYLSLDVLLSEGNNLHPAVEVDNAS